MNRVRESSKLVNKSSTSDYNIENTTVFDQAIKALDLDQNFGN